MTITVVTAERGSKTFEANDWEVDDERLWVGTGDVGVAEFARGEWSYVFETVEPKPETAKPRVWDSLYVTPWTVKVVDRDGEHGRGRWHWGTGSFKLDADEVRTGYNIYAPFTEVLSG